MAKRRKSWPDKGEKSKKRPPGRLKGARITVQPSYAISALVERFSLNGAILTYQDVADNLTAKTGLRVTRADAWRLARDLETGKVPRNTNKLRAALGLPCYAPAPVCVKCGIVHVTKKCTANRKPAAPRVNWKKAYMELLGAPVASLPPRRQWKRLATWAASMLVYMEGAR